MKFLFALSRVETFQRKRTRYPLPKFVENVYSVVDSEYVDTSSMRALSLDWDSQDSDSAARGLKFDPHIPGPIPTPIYSRNYLSI